MQRFFIWISRYLLAFTFIFSGFVKGIDPLGSAYKFGDYFVAFRLNFLESLTIPLAFILCAAELLIGLLLLFRVKDFLAIWGAFLFMLVFTPLTFYLAIFNPVSDCGCFGDAIVLSNWETFFKNLPLLAASVYLFYQRKKIQPSFKPAYSHAIASLLLFISFVPSFQGYRNLPLMDFRPYSIGTNIVEAMTLPEGAPVDEYKTLLYYEKGGVTKEFSQENFPWQDSTWSFVDSKSILVKKGFTPPITDFSLVTTDDWFMTDSILQFDGYYLLAIAHRLDKSDTESFARLNELYHKAKEQNMGFACITSSPPNEIDEFIGKTGVGFPFLLADEIMLKTVIRANPGLVALNRGTIIGKWHYRNIPEPTFFEGDVLAKSLQQQQAKRARVWTWTLMLGLVLLGFTIHPFRAKD